VISFIIPAYNEERLIGCTLATLRQAAQAVGEPFEIIVVDDASSDRTGAIAQEHHAQVILVNHRQIAATRNAGARIALGSLFVFVDADTLVGDTVLRAMLRAIRTGAVGGGCGFRFDGPLPLYAQVLQPLSVWLYRLIGLASGSFLFCTREAFAAVGGFNEELYAAEEGAMSLALKRLGRFVVLREQVETSGRKLRAYSPREIFCVLGRMLVSGGKSVRRRKGLEIWYGERRDDPAPAVGDDRSK
jgi:glycosyltransferase involved in cell wall biosynthesis